MIDLRHSSLRVVALVVLGAVCIGPGSGHANENVVGRPSPESTISPQDAANAQVHSQRTLTDPRQLSEKVRAVLGLSSNAPPVAMALPPEEFGGKRHPFTTKNASAENDSTPTEKYPWRATGKMFMKFGASTFVCTGSVIGKGLLVTAAHCVHNFGDKQSGFVNSITFEPARHNNSAPFGTWTAKEWWIPKVYFEGTDICSATAPGVVCENDVAVVVVEKKDNRFIADVTGKFGFKSKDYGYGELFGNKVAQITQLGYPSKDYDGLKMIRTDALGYQDAPNNVIIGSAQTGGSSGGPWLQNFGVKTSFTGLQPLADDDNQVVATTSWGFNSGTIMVQGASRFSTNQTYTVKSNIESLFNSACGANPGFC
jgi:V8-like Glu-specific endopeptidase